MEILYVTTNKGKVQSLSRDLASYNITIRQEAMDIPEPRSSDVEIIAREKARYAFEKLQQPVVVLDAGFYIPSINGFPRAFVNFALETVGIQGILKLIEGKERHCDFRECLAYTDKESSESHLFTAFIRGSVASEPRGHMQPHLWSELALIFVPEGREKTLAEMTSEEYAALWKSLSIETSAGRMFGEWYVKHHS